MSEKSERDVMIIGAARTATGKLGGGLSSQSAPELGGAAVAAGLERAGVDRDRVYEVIMGNVVSAGVGQAPARQAAAKAGLKREIGAMTINKVCGSGLKAVMLAANGIAAGEGSLYVAGGMESMSNAPYLLPKAREGLRFGDTTLHDSLMHDGLWCAFEQWPMGNAAEFIARQFEISRAEMDAFAYRSHEKAAQATADGRFRAEIAPITIQTRKTSFVVDTDESIRAKFENGGYDMLTSPELLAKLRPAFAADGQVTAGNAPGINDGAAALIITSRKEAERQGAAPLARIVGQTYAALEPKWLFAAPAKAMPQLLEKVGWRLEDVDLIELNEAFAAQVLANGAEMQRKGHAWDWEKVNVNGGAVALGHPIGASGARVLVTLIHALQQRGLKRGIAALCLGGGEAVAMAIEME